MDVKEAIEKLENWFSKIEASMVAFSGGVDSTLVLFLSKYFLNEKAIGVIGDSPSLKRKDFKEAVSFCKSFRIKYEVVNPKEINDFNYSNNPVNRCYFCKDALYTTMKIMKKKYTDHIMLNGTNLNDLGDYRPGLEAAKEQDVRSPLQECGIDKKMTRLLANHFKLPNWNKPASPCLSSRIPYGQSVTVEKLKKIELAEEYISSLGFSEVRVRCDKEYARIEVPKSEVDKLLVLKDKQLDEIYSYGFKKIEIDTEGLVSGKLNRVLKK